MYYSFQSSREHNLYTITKRRLHELLWPAAILLIIQYGFPKSTFAKNNWHWYTFLIVEAFKLFSVLTSDNVREIIIDTAKKYLVLSYYNIYQGNMEEKFSLDEIKAHIETTYSKEVRQIEFVIKKRADIVLDKNNFSAADLISIKDLLYTITSPKSR